VGGSRIVYELFCFCSAAKEREKKVEREGPTTTKPIYLFALEESAGASAAALVVVCAAELRVALSVVYARSFHSAAAFYYTPPLSTSALYLLLHHQLFDCTAPDSAAHSTKLFLF